nr:MAG TPA: hypothetical protein [Caudoviricetes sp.]
MLFSHKAAFFQIYVLTKYNTILYNRSDTLFKVSDI